MRIKAHIRWYILYAVTFWRLPDWLSTLLLFDMPFGLSPVKRTRVQDNIYRWYKPIGSYEKRKIWFEGETND